MNMSDQERIIIPDENDEEHLFTVIYKFDVESTGQHYVALIPSEQEDSEEQDLYVFRIEEDEEDLRLFQIEDDDEWEIIEETIATLEENDLI